VYACAVFASLNAILLGYGEFAARHGDPSLRMKLASFFLLAIYFHLVHHGIVA